MSAPADTVPGAEVVKLDTEDEVQVPTAATDATAETPTATESTAAHVSPVPAPAVPEPSTSPAEPIPTARQRAMVGDDRLGVLRAMFPDFDDSLLQSVLDSVNGNTDHAIDALLGMSDPDYMSEQTAVPQVQTSQTQEQLDEQLARTLAMEDERAHRNAWDPQAEQQYQQPQPRPEARRRPSEGPEKDTMQELQEQFNKIAESGKRTFGTLFSKVKAKIQEFDQPAGAGGQSSNTSYGAYGANQPPPAAGRHAQTAYYQQQQAQEQAQMPAYYDPNAASDTTPPSSATAAGYDAAPTSMTPPAGATPSPPATNTGAPQIDGGKLGMLPKRPVSLLRTNSPPAGGQPPSSDEDELEYAENPFEEGKK
ncbi:hypothetical protein GGX14DRAFT_445647 [Mycena pura]|uniref:CUE domain-containing protein n=1 Tax=Mycena pura TaxID=153505 RepID=A0AAD6VIA8_9AGAR|nr:hypothetical protein GGX14DRAFT_445647 [Mycena pura]